jgi:predicted DCC family thiol-disulfide oxidoreductase YuxK
MDTLYYDGHCPLCTKEIRLLRRLANAGLEFRDIHTLADPHQPDRVTLLRTLHLQTHDGWLTGLSATVGAWQHTGYGWMFRPLLWPGLTQIASRVYRIWANRRFDRRYCSSGQCQLPASRAD